MGNDVNKYYHFHVNTNYFWSSFLIKTEKKNNPSNQWQLIKLSQTLWNCSSKITTSDNTVKVSTDIWLSLLSSTFIQLLSSSCSNHIGKLKGDMMWPPCLHPLNFCMWLQLLSLSLRYDFVFDSLPFPKCSWGVRGVTAEASTSTSLLWYLLSYIPNLYQLPSCWSNLLTWAPGKWPPDWSVDLLVLL